MIELDNNKLFSLHDMAKMFSVQPNTISSWRRKKLIEPVQISERKYLYSIESIKKMIDYHPQPKNNMNSKFANEYTSAEVQQILRITAATLSNWRKANLINYRTVSQRKIFYDKKEIDNIKTKGIKFENFINNEEESNIEIDNVNSNGIKNSPLYKKQLKTFIKDWSSVLQFKVNDFEKEKHNIFLNYASSLVNYNTSPIVMMNNNMELIDVISDKIIVPQSEIKDFIINLQKSNYPLLDYSKTLKENYEDFYIFIKKS